MGLGFFGQGYLTQGSNSPGVIVVFFNETRLKFTYFEP